MLFDLTLSTDEDGEEAHTSEMNNRPAPAATPTTPAEWANAACVAIVNDTETWEWLFRHGKTDIVHKISKAREHSVL